MDDNLIYLLIAVVSFFAYKKYKHHQVLKLVPSLLEEGGQIIDVRTEEEFSSAHKEGSINISLNAIQSKAEQLDNTKPIILCCASGSRSGMAKRILMSKGFEKVYNAGSWKSLKKFD